MSSASVSPRALPVVGHAPSFVHDKLGFLLRAAAAAHGPVRLELGGETLLLTDAEDIEHVLLGNQRNYVKTPRLTGRRGRRLLGEGMLTSTGTEHLEKRRRVAPAFNRRSAASFGEVTTDTVLRTIARWSPGDELDVAAEMQALTRRVLLSVLFGPDTPEIGELDADLALRQRHIDRYFRSLVPFPELVPTPLTLRHRSARRRIEETFRRAIAERRRDGGRNGDLLSLLLETEPSDERIANELLILSITGYETLGAALTWTWHALSQHPQFEQKLVDELRRVLKGRTATVADIPDLPYLDRVFCESLRLFPPTWIFVRIAVDADVLPSGAAVGPGSKLYLCQYVTHRDPRYWTDPERFDPQRFGAEETAERPEFAYFPFGGGLRLCIGKPLATMEAALVLATIAQRFRLVAVRDRVVRPEPGVILAPEGGLRMRLEAR